MSHYVTVIIPSLNSPLIDQVVYATLAQEPNHYLQEVIVVGRDEANLIPQTPKVRFIDTGQSVLAAVARNMGAAAAQTDLLVFLDSDCLPETGWLAGHVAAHHAGHPIVSGGVVPTGTSYWHLVYNLTLFHQVLSVNPAGARDFLATLNLSVEREVFARVGGMDERINRVEDVDWTTRMRRAGIQPYFWPTAAVRHTHNRLRFSQVWRDCALSGYHMRQLRLQHADLLEAPGVLRYPKVVLGLSPLIAAWATGRILWERPFLLRRFIHTVPAIYITKIAWCWGAAQPSEPGTHKK